MMAIGALTTRATSARATRIFGSLMQQRWHYMWLAWLQIALVLLLLGSGSPLCTANCHGFDLQATAAHTNPDSHPAQAYVQADAAPSPRLPAPLIQADHCAFCHLGPLVIAMVVALVLLMLGYCIRHRLIVPDPALIPITPPPQCCSS